MDGRGRFPGLGCPDRSAGGGAKRQARFDKRAKRAAAKRAAAKRDRELTGYPSLVLTPLGLTQCSREPDQRDLT